MSEDKEINCIYCEKNKDKATFNGREHVIPKLMGSFKNNLTIDRVCDNCNSKIFNPLETKFKEDTEEGIFYQMFNLKNSCQIRIRGRNVKTSFSSGLGNNFFNEMFPFFRQCDGDWKIFLLPQIKIKRYGSNGYLILLVDELKKLKQNQKKFLKIKKSLKNVQNKDVSIFTNSNSITDNQHLEEAIKLVNDLGIEYKEKTRKVVSTNNQNKKEFEISMDCNVGNEVGRVIAKIAFNYFAYCAINSQQGDILFHQNFSKIKSYVLGKINLPIKEVIVNLGTEPIIYDEKIKNTRLIYHTVTFSIYNNDVISEISFLGKRIYTVILGHAPQELLKTNFGCGHVFDPINKKILGLTQNANKRGSDQEIGFGLFNRI